jgi:hypothetical protein
MSITFPNMPKATPRAASRLLPAALALVAMSEIASAQTVLPADAKPTCTVSAVEFSHWFTSGTVTANGSVEPADSLTFPGNSLCSFYKWSEQMFLWLTSPAPSRYHSNALVLNSPVFYDVTPLDASGQRSMILVNPGFRNFGPKISQLGPRGLPVVFDHTGKMFPVVRPETGPSGLPIVRNKAGERIEAARTQIANGRPVFLDKEGKAIDTQVGPAGHPRLFDRTNRAIDIQPNSILVNGRTFFLDFGGNAIETEQGQAGDGSVLLTINGKLVYYALSVNDVYAYFLTGQKDGAITASRFPTTGSNLSAIQTFALAHSKTFPDAHALTVETKSAWIETTGLANVNQYVTITATIPTYDTSNPTHWVHNGTKQAQLALVGIHVVGSTLGHPEMLWATFEHVNNTRNAPYTYTNGSNATTPVPSEVGGTWLFSHTPATASQNVATGVVSGADIVSASPPTPIGPSDILRVNPWGTAATPAPTFTANNTDIISINNSVIGQLLAGDIRKNYIMTGTTWTAGGQVPPPGPGAQVGTNHMANSTMETFFQGSNCFNCHDGSNMLGGTGGQTGLSHIWGPLKPLFP